MGNGELKQREKGRGVRGPEGGSKLAWPSKECREVNGAGKKGNK